MSMVQHPFIYEINTWVWIDELRGRHGETVGLADVPPSEWDAIAALGFDAVWLMGVWERSPAGITIALQNTGLLEDFEHALPGFTADDVVGSPYCIRDYTVAGHLGGPAGLASARRALADRGLGLILDFVPNHVAPDHPWLADHPEYFVRGDAEDLARDPAGFLAVGDSVIARGRDPFFPPWPDVAQLYSSSVLPPSARDASIQAVSSRVASENGKLRVLGCLAYDPSALEDIPDFSRTAEPWMGWWGWPSWIVSARVEKVFKQRQLRGWAFRPVLVTGTPLYDEYCDAWRRLRDRVRESARSQFEGGRW